MLVKFTQDRRSLRKGYVSVYINPSHVSAIIRNDCAFDEDNKTAIIMENGEKIVVQDYPEEVSRQLSKAEKDTHESNI